MELPINILEKIKKSTALPAVILFTLLLVLNAFIMNGTMSYNFLINLLNTNTAVACIAIGVSVVIITGEIDISMGAIVSVVNVLLIQLLSKGISFQLAIFAALLAAIVMGALNGLFVAVFRGSSLLITFATSKIFSGLALILQPVPGGRIPRAMSAFYRIRFFEFLPTTLFFILIPFLIWKFYKNTIYGPRLYAAGASKDKAYTSGVNVAGEKFFSFIFAGFASGMGAVAITCSVGAGDPLIGSSLSMTALSAAVIGGVALSGGYGDVSGGIFASLFLALITVLVMSANVNPYMQQFVSALIILIGLIGAVAFGSLKKGRNQPHGQ